MRMEERLFLSFVGVFLILILCNTISIPSIVFCAMQNQTIITLQSISYCIVYSWTYKINYIFYFYFHVSVFGVVACFNFYLPEVGGVSRTKQNVSLGLPSCQNQELEEEEQQSSGVLSEFKRTAGNMDRSLGQMTCRWKRRSFQNYLNVVYEFNNLHQKARLWPDIW